MSKNIRNTTFQVILDHTNNSKQQIRQRLVNSQFQNQMRIDIHIEQNLNEIKYRGYLN